MSVGTAIVTLGTLAALLAGPAAGQTAAPPIAEIRVHGNHSTPDAEVIVVSGLAVGQPSGEAELAAARERLRASGRFRSAEVQRRGRSIDDPDDVLVVILIEELPGSDPDLPTPGWLRRRAAGVMWIPALSYREGYGVTYGLRMAIVDLFGERSRLSVPLTWGGERRAGVALERSFERGPLTRLSGAANVVRTVHPAFDRVERRTGADARAERALAPWLRVAALARVDDVRFDGRVSRVSAAGGDLVVDTRLDPGFPRNAVWVTAGLERLTVDAGARRRHRVDANGAVGLPAGSALSARVFQVSSDGALPPFEQAWIGGAATLRGHRAGYRADDNAVGASASLAYPLGSPLDVVRTGPRAFIDWAAVYPAGTSWRDASFDRGAGAGWFLSAPGFTLGVDVARGGGRTRVHVRLGTAF